MAQLNTSFDSSNYDDMNDFEPIPIGNYAVQVTKSEIKTTKAGNGNYIRFEFTVLRGEYKGRKIWTNLNIVNPNPVAVEIAQKELATLCRACGKAIIQDTQQVHGIPFTMKVGISPAKGDYPASNKVMGYEKIGSSAGKKPDSDANADPFGDEAKTSKTEEPGGDSPWSGDAGSDDAGSSDGFPSDGFPDDDIPF